MSSTWERQYTGWRATLIVLAVLLVTFVPWFVGVVALLGWAF